MSELYRPENLEDEDVLLIILVSLLGYEEENNKKFSVDKDVLAGVFANAMEKRGVPILNMKHTDDNRLQLSVVMESGEEFKKRFVVE